MNKKLIGLILIFISLIIALVLIYLTFFYNPAVKKAAEQSGPKTSETPVATTTVVREPVVVLPKPKESNPAPVAEVNEEGARQVAGSFVELYGSYSNQADASRLKDLKFYTTTEYLNKISQLTKNINDDYKVYSGYNARVIATQVLILEDKRAVMMVTALRTEKKADDNERSFNQDIKIELVKIGESWRVNNAVWQ